MTGKKNDARTGPSVGRRTSAAIVLAVACGSGTALGQSSGDFNGDGYADLAIGVPGENSGAGAVNVFYGSAAGLTAAGDMRFYQSSPRVPSLVGHAEAGDRLGSSLAVGDFNGDGFDDLAIGVPFEDSYSIENSGGVNVVYGSADGLTLVGNQFWDQEVTSVDGAAERNDWFGFSLAAGDFDANGADDLAIGVPGEDFELGIVQVLYGWPPDGLLAIDEVWGFSDALYYGQLGSSLAAGDFNGDGHDDLASGTAAQTTDYGELVVFSGTPNGLRVSRVYYQSIDGTEPDGGIPGDPCSGLGFSLAAGDLNGDGMDELAIGVPGMYDLDAGTNHSGQVIVGFGLLVGAGAGFRFLTPPVDELEDDDEFGYSVAIGRLNSDHRAELAVGVRGENQSTGAVHFFRGTASGGPVPWRIVGAKVLGGASTGDRFGESLAIGDFDGDGRHDVAFGVPGDDVVSASGATIGNAGSVTVKGLAFSYWTLDSAGVLGSIGTDDSFGASLGR